MYVIFLVALGIIYMLVPLGIIYLVVNAIANLRHRSGKKAKPPYAIRRLTDRSVVMWSLGVASLYAAIVGLELLPSLIFGVNHTVSQGAAIRSVAGLVFIIAGYLIKSSAGKMLMIFGIALTIFTLPSVFTGFSNIVVFILILIGFIALLYLASKYGQNGNNDEE